MKQLFRKIKQINYMHYIAVALTMGVAAFYFRFPYALGRLIEGVRDMGVSIGYYCVELFGGGADFPATVNNYPKVPFFASGTQENTPNFPLPATFAEFKAKWVLYWQTFIKKENVFAYFSALAKGLRYFLCVLLFGFPVIIVIVILLRRASGTINTDHGKESKPLKIFKKCVSKTYIPVKSWCLSFVDFLKTHSVYYKIWLCLWLFYFNAFTIVCEFIAYYFYFVVSFDFVNLYRQLYKLFFDLWAVIDFTPPWLLVIFGVWLLNKIAIGIGYAELYHGENCNRGFINERGVVTVVYGSMGVGKTAFITDMALSAEVQQRDDALEIILECDMKFPCFPWIKLEDELKAAFENHTVFSVPSCVKFMREKFLAWYKLPTDENIFGYDFRRYGLEYDDGLQLTYIWNVLKDYACAYLIYTVKTSLILSNYSIRTDMLLSDVGNFPLWNADFFKRDSRLLDSFSRHAHILDFDMLRLGKTMLEHNPNATAFGFGVYVISEIDKERKNTPELAEIKRDDKKCNQKNDLFNVLLKMSRHACVVANRVFVKIFADLQRPESLGADTRELGEIVYIKEKSEPALTLPFFSPFYFFELLYLWAKSKFDGAYLNHRYTRGDYTLLPYLLKCVYAKMFHLNQRTYNTFGRQTMLLEVESGRMDGLADKKKYYRQFKKIWSGRYATDCLSAIFTDRAEVNTIGIDDMKTYHTIIATNDELKLQNSHFQAEISKITNAEKMEKAKA